jgi:hypothetical protein
MLERALLKVYILKVYNNRIITNGKCILKIGPEN